MNTPALSVIGRMMWYCLPSVIRMSSMPSLRPSDFMVFILARTTSVLPAPATSRSTPPPALPRTMPLFESTTAAAVAPSICISSSSDCERLPMVVTPRWFASEEERPRIRCDIRSQVDSCRQQPPRQRTRTFASRVQDRAEADAVAAQHAHQQVMAPRRDAQGHQRAGLGIDDHVLAALQAHLAGHRLAEREQRADHRRKLLDRHVLAQHRGHLEPVASDDRGGVDAGCLRDQCLERTLAKYLQHPRAHAALPATGTWLAARASTMATSVPSMVMTCPDDLASTANTGNR